MSARTAFLCGGGSLLLIVAGFAAGLAAWVRVLWHDLSGYAAW